MILSSFFGYLAVAVGLAAYVPYYRSIVRGVARPHVFSWFIWGLLTAIGFAAQISDGAGAGAWVTGVSVLGCFGLAGLALKYGEKNITRSDWLCLCGTMLAIPVWLMTENPLGAVILVSLIDAAGFYPTFRKSWHRPDQERLLYFCLAGLKFTLGIAAMEHISLVTTLYPASLVATNWGFVAYVMARRYVKRTA